MKFNKSVASSTKTVNRAGGLSYKTDEKTELFLRCASCLFGEGKYYASGSALTSELISLTNEVLKKDPEFVLKIAYYCRTTLNLRSVPLVLLTEYANSNAVGTVPNARKYVSATIQRADEATEILAYQFARNKVTNRTVQKIPMVMKKGVADALNKFDAYQLSKYERNTATVKLKDAILLTHPKAIDNHQSELFKKVIDGTIEPPKTWEVTLSNWRENFSSKKEAWESVVGKMGIMALTRNLRNLLEEGINSSLYAKRFEDSRAIANSRMYPFRFYSAYREVEKMSGAKNMMDVSTVLRSLDTAVDLSVENLPKLEGNTCVMVDLSGSMNTPLSEKSSVTYRNISALMGSIANEMSENAVVIAFATDAKSVPLSTRNSVISNMKQIENTHVGGSTYAEKAMKLLKMSDTEVDRIILLSDMQCYSQSSHGETVQYLLNQYRKKYPNTYMYSIDLAGYGTTLFPSNQENKNILISGWSEKIFEFIDVFEKDRSTQIREIESISIS